MVRRLGIEPLEPRQMLAPVVPAVETVNAGGAADDIAIWIHPSDPAQSRVIGAIKSGGSAMEVYRLDGARVQTVTSGDINNIDLRYNFPMAGGAITLLAGSNRANDSIALYQIDSNGLLTGVAARSISTGIDIYGCAMYVSPISGKYYVFVSSEGGEIQQWELWDAGGGKVDATKVRQFDVGRITEGLVADDVTGLLYAAEEDVGIWRYSAEPNASTSRVRIDSTGSGGHLKADVEGLAIFYRPNGKGYLIASSQGSDDFVVYQRDAGNAFVGRFQIIAHAGIDAVADTDGIDITNVSLGGAFPSGLFVAQDSDTNFKLVRWEVIATAIGAEVDTTWDPRRVGAAPPPPNSQGDFNGDHQVDAADYTLWRNQLGTSRPAFSGADANGDGNVTHADYLIWKASFGMTIGSEAGSQLVAPKLRESAPQAPAASPWPRGKGPANAYLQDSIGEHRQRSEHQTSRQRLLAAEWASQKTTSPPDATTTFDARSDAEQAIPIAAIDQAWSEWADPLESPL